MLRHGLVLRTRGRVQKVVFILWSSNSLPLCLKIEIFGPEKSLKETRVLEESWNSGSPVSSAFLIHLKEKRVKSLHLSAVQRRAWLEIIWWCLQ